MKYYRVVNTVYEKDFDSVIVLNLYPYITSNSDKLPREKDEESFKKNFQVIKDIAQELAKPKVLCGWGAKIEKYPYLRESLKEIYALFPESTVWMRVDDNILKHPRHPSRGKIDNFFEFKKIKEYISSVCKD